MRAPMNRLAPLLTAIYSLPGPAVLLLRLALLVTLVASPYAAQPPNDAELLLAFKATFDNGEEVLRTWDGDDPCVGTWLGVHCDGPIVNTVNEIFLDNNHPALRGRIPTDGWALPPTLVHLSLSGNTLQGPLPESWPGLPPALGTLDLSHNGLTGTLPTFVFEPLSPNKLTVIRLYLQNNSFEGQLPEWSNIQKGEVYVKPGNRLLCGVVPKSPPTFCTKVTYTPVSTYTPGPPKPPPPPCEPLTYLQACAPTSPSPIPEPVPSPRPNPSPSLSGDLLSPRPPPLPPVSPLPSPSPEARPSPPLANETVADAELLLELMYSFANGRAVLSNWGGPGEDPCSGWSGVTCDSSGQIIMIELQGLGLQGLLQPVELPMSLQVLDLGTNRLSGSLPELWDLPPNLQVLDVFNNSLAGSLPSWASMSLTSVLVKPGNAGLCGKVPTSPQYFIRTLPGLAPLTALPRCV